MKTIQFNCADGYSNPRKPCTPSLRMSHIRQTNDQDPHYPSYDTEAIDMAVMLGHRLEIRCGPRAWSLVADNGAT